MGFSEEVVRVRSQLVAAPQRSFRRRIEYMDALRYLIELGFEVASLAAKKALSDFVMELQQRRAARGNRFFEYFRGRLSDLTDDDLQARIAMAKTRMARRIIKAEQNRRRGLKYELAPMQPAVPVTEAMRVFRGSDGQATRRLLKKLEALGPLGWLAAALFRCQKASSRAKQYRGKPGVGRRSHREYAYDAKQAALWRLTDVLAEMGESISWGWKPDNDQPQNPWVLYVDLPNGQVSFHSPERGDGPQYAGEWDQRYASESRIIWFCDHQLAQGCDACIS